MAQVSLKGRTIGPWAGFEREVLAASEHAGWVRYVGRRQVQLRKSPFLPPDPTRTYVLPEDVVLDEEELVELIVERPLYDVRSLARGSALADDYEKVYDVQSARVLSLPMPRPYLDTDDFLHRVIMNWKDGDEDHLDKSIALQLLSCPRTAMGPGGIGSQSFDLSGASKALDDLRRSIEACLAREGASAAFVVAGIGSLVEARIRYRATPRPARVWPQAGGRMWVTFAEAVRDITPGQAVVLYRGDEVLGGGVIARASA